MSSTQYYPLSPRAKVDISTASPVSPSSNVAAPPASRAPPPRAHAVTRVLKAIAGATLLAGGSEAFNANYYSHIGATNTLQAHPLFPNVSGLNISARPDAKDHEVHLRPAFPEVLQDLNSYPEHEELHYDKTHAKTLDKKLHEELTALLKKTYPTRNDPLQQQVRAYLSNKNAPFDRILRAFMTPAKYQDHLLSIVHDAPFTATALSGMFALTIYSQYDQKLSPGLYALAISPVTHSLSYNPYPITYVQSLQTLHECIAAHLDELALYQIHGAGLVPEYSSLARRGCLSTILVPMDTLVFTLRHLTDRRQVQTLIDYTQDLLSSLRGTHSTEYSDAEKVAAFYLNPQDNKADVAMRSLAGKLNRLKDPMKRKTRTTVIAHLAPQIAIFSQLRQAFEKVVTTLRDQEIQEIQLKHLSNRLSEDQWTTKLGLNMREADGVFADLYTILENFTKAHHTPDGNLFGSLILAITASMVKLLVDNWWNIFVLMICISVSIISVSVYVYTQYFGVTMEAAITMTVKYRSSLYTKAIPDAVTAHKAAYRSLREALSVAQGSFLPDGKLTTQQKDDILTLYQNEQNSRLAVKKLIDFGKAFEVAANSLRSSATYGTAPSRDLLQRLISSTLIAMNRIVIFGARQLHTLVTQSSSLARHESDDVSLDCITSLDQNLQKILFVALHGVQCDLKAREEDIMEKWGKFLQDVVTRGSLEDTYDQLIDLTIKASQIAVYPEGISNRVQQIAIGLEEILDTFSPQDQDKLKFIISVVQRLLHTQNATK